MPDLRVQDVKIYNFDDKHQLRSILSAKEGEFGNGVWNLRQVEDVRFEGNGFTRTTLEHLAWESLIHPETLESLAVSPNFLPMPALYQYITYLQDNRLDASRYELAFWIKLVKPFSALIMLLIAMPFVFGPLRSVGVGQRLLVGILLGLGFHLFNQALNYTVLGYGLNPLISALLPSLLFTVGGVLAIRKLR
jgi:lipopolysaccharide export system permease protein